MNTAELQTLNVAVDNLLSKLAQAEAMLDDVLGVHERVTSKKCDSGDGRLGALEFSLAVCNNHFSVVLTQLQRLVGRVG